MILSWKNTIFVEILKKRRLYAFLCAGDDNFILIKALHVYKGKDVLRKPTYQCADNELWQLGEEFLCTCRICWWDIVFLLNLKWFLWGVKIIVSLPVQCTVRSRGKLQVRFSPPTIFVIMQLSLPANMCDQMYDVKIAVTVSTLFLFLRRINQVLSNQLILRISFIVCFCMYLKFNFISLLALLITQNSYLQNFSKYFRFHGGWSIWSKMYYP